MSDTPLAGGCKLPPEAFDAARAVSEICRDAWARGLFAGFNGNVSCVLAKPFQGKTAVLVTRSGTAKFSLSDEGFAILDMETGAPLWGGRPSTEAVMHLEVYRAAPLSKALMHTHPPHLLALSLRLPFEQRLDMPLFEAEAYRKIMGLAKALEPGSDELARAVGERAAEFKAVWMERHGLTVHGSSLKECLAVSEELEQLARIKLLALQG